MLHKILNHCERILSGTTANYLERTLRFLGMDLLSPQVVANALSDDGLLIRLSRYNLADFAMQHILPIDCVIEKEIKKIVMHTAYRLHSDVLRMLINDLDVDTRADLFAKKIQPFVADLNSHLLLSPEAPVSVHDVRCFSQSVKNAVYAVTIMQQGQTRTAVLKYSEEPFRQKGQAQHELFVSRLLAMVGMPFTKTTLSAASSKAFVMDYINGETSDQLAALLKENPSRETYRHLIQRFAQYAAIFDVIGKGDRRPNLGGHHPVQGNYMFDPQGELWSIDNDFLYNPNDGVAKPHYVTLSEEARNGSYESAILSFSDHVAEDRALFKEKYMEMIAELRTKQAEIDALLADIYADSAQAKRDLIRHNLVRYDEQWIDLLLSLTPSIK